MYTQIFHLADLHIRKGNKHECRYEEYLQVFTQCINDIVEIYKPNEAICVICGDIFHHKLQISPPGIKLFYSIVYKLANYMPIIIIQGNHDFLQQNAIEDKIDLIEALLNENEHHNIHYLKDTGNYEFDNINFGLVSIVDILKSGASSGKVDNLPIFPKSKDNKINIALSHVTINNCKLHNYTNASSGVSLDWFNGYNYVLLGDVHLQHVKYNKKNNIYYGYPGSLVQQDFGESIFNHGFLVWNIEKISVEKFHVYNETSRANIKLIENEYHISIENYRNISHLPTYKKLPKNLHVRLYCKDNMLNNIDYVSNFLKENGILCNIDINNYTHTHSASDNDDSEKHINISTINSNDTIIEYIKNKGNHEILSSVTNWENYITNTETLKIEVNTKTPECLKEIIQKKNTSISKFCDKLKELKEICKTNTNYFKINKISFDWILPFGKNNIFNFNTNQTTLINAPNGYGKSAFFECIVLGLYGEPIPSRYNKSTSVSIISKQKPFNQDSSKLEIEFTLVDTTYKIKRIFIEQQDKKNVSRLYAKIVELYREDTLIKSGANVVNKWVQDNICNIDNFLLSTMITQNTDNDFFRMKVSDQIDLLDSALHIENVNIISDIFKSCKKEYKDINNHINTILSTAKPQSVYDNTYLIATKHKHESIKNEIYQTKEKNDNINININEYNSFDIDNVIYSNIPLEELLSSKKTIEHQIHILKQQISNESIDKLYDDVDSIHSDDIKFFCDDSSNKSYKGDLTNNITNVLHDLKTKFDIFQANNKNFKNIENEEPTQPQKTLKDYETYIGKKNFIETSLNDYSINIDVIPTKPSISIQDITIMQSDIYNSISDKYLDMGYEDILQIINDLEINISEYKTIIVNIIEVIEVPKPYIMLKDCQIYIDTHNINKHTINENNINIDKNNKFIQEYKELLDKKVILNTYDLVFNDTCTQCNTNKELVTISNEDSILLDTQISKKEKKYKRLTEANKKILNQNELIQINEDAYTIHVDQSKAWDNYTCYMKQYSEEQEYIKEVNTNLITSNIQLKLMKSIDQFQKKKIIVDKLLNDWTIWKKHIKYKDIIQEYDNIKYDTYYWDTELPIVNKYISWKTKYIESNEILKKSEHEYLIASTKFIKSYQFQNVSNQIFKLNGELLSILPNIMFYVNTKKELSNLLEILDYNERDMFVELTNCTMNQKQYEEYSQLERHLGDIAISLTRNVTLFDMIINLMKNFKSYIYNDKLLPVIVTNTNNIVNTIFPDRNLQLLYKFVDNNILWSVKDENNEIYLEKLSGAQSFAMSLGFRLALSSLGISKYKCNQLFIDEGFCSFDQNNLNNVPNLIKNLRKLFDEIYLVSHLDEIQNCTDKVINISRKNGISYIKN
jgi:DNA repair exonuclease SbcCD ATPase subunit